MSTNNFEGYNPPSPAPGLTVINIVSVEEKTDGTYINYDIGIGPSAGYAFVRFQQTGRWPLVWRIGNSPNAEVVYQCALKAAQATDPDIDSLEDVKNISIIAELQYDKSEGVRVCRSYPLDRHTVLPADIRIGINSWAKGSSDYIRATLIAKNSGLPVMLADVHEKDSPMVEWCAENRIAILPMTFPVGDYRLPQHDTIVDRKTNILELYEDFVVPDKRRAYETDADFAAACGQRLVYVTATEPGDNVNGMKDLKNWSKPIPGQKPTADGVKLLYLLNKHKELFSNVEFRFCDSKKLCSTIYNVLQN